MLTTGARRKILCCTFFLFSTRGGFWICRFEIADLWCTGVRVREYVVFIHSLLESIARVKFETPTSGSHSNSSAVRVLVGNVLLAKRRAVRFRACPIRFGNWYDGNMKTQVAKVELKDDAAINHDRFVHDVDKGTVTGTVFREMEIPDDPLDDDVEVLQIFCTCAR